MRGLAKIMALVLLPLVGLAACDRESDAAPSAAYDTSAASNAKSSSLTAHASATAAIAEQAAAEPAAAAVPATGLPERLRPF